MSWEHNLRSGAPDAGIAEKVVSALRSLFSTDSFLLESDAHERSISHRLALHLTPLFQEYDVDCEYNRDKHDPKVVDLPAICTSQSTTDGSYVFPDIIVHHRNTDNNLLVIEIKKSTSSVSERCDIEKLKAFRQQLRYQHGLFIRLQCGTTAGLDKVRWI